jgi:uncharacterized membrane protein YbhN (UPF0104 family)
VKAAAGGGPTGRGPAWRTLAWRTLAVARSRRVRWAFGVVAVALAVWALAGQWAEVVHALRRLDPGWFALALIATLANAATAGLAWRRMLADLGSRLPLLAAARVFFVGQLGKYVPGSVWPMVMQAELASDHGVARRRTAAATVVTLLLSVAGALGVVVVTLPFVPDVVPPGFGWAVFLIAPLLVLLYPAVLDRVISKGLTLLGREPLERRTSLRGTAAATGWVLVSWTTAGVQVWALAVSLGAPATARTFALTTGGYALAWAVGFIVVIAPAGAGAREVALAAVLSTVLGHAAWLVVVLLSRVLFTAVDLALAGLGVAVGRGRQKATPSRV